MNTNTVTDQFSCNVCELNFKTEQHYAIHCKGHLHAERLAASLKAQNKISIKSTLAESTVPIQTLHKPVVLPTTTVNLNKQIGSYAQQSQDFYGNWKSNTSISMAHFTSSLSQAIASTSYDYSTSLNQTTITQPNSTADYYGVNPAYTYPNNEQGNHEQSANPYYYSQSYPTSNTNTYVPTTSMPSFPYYGHGSEYYPTTCQNYIGTSSSLDNYNYAFAHQTYGNPETSVVASTQPYSYPSYDHEQVNKQTPFLSNQTGYNQAYDQYNYNNTTGFQQSTNYEQFQPPQNTNFPTSTVTDPANQYNWQTDSNNYSSSYQSSWQQFNTNYPMTSAPSIQSKNFNQANQIDNANNTQVQQANWNYPSFMPPTSTPSIQIKNFNQTNRMENTNDTQVQQNNWNYPSFMPPTYIPPGEQYKTNFSSNPPEHGKESMPIQNYGAPCPPNLPWSQQSQMNINGSFQYGSHSSSTGKETNINRQNLNTNKNDITNFHNLLKEGSDFNGSQTAQYPWQQSKNLGDPWNLLKPESNKMPIEREANIDWRPLINKNQAISEPPNPSKQFGQSFKNPINNTMPTMVQPPYGNLNISKPEFGKEPNVQNLSNLNDYNKIGYSYENKPLNYNSRYSENIIPNSSHSRIENSGRSKEFDNKNFKNIFNQDIEIKQNINNSITFAEDFGNKRKDYDKQYLENNRTNNFNSKFANNQANFQSINEDNLKNQDQNKTNRSVNNNASKIVPLLSIKTKLPMGSRQTEFSQNINSNKKDSFKFKDNEDYKDRNWNNEEEDYQQQNWNNLQNKNYKNDNGKSFSFNDLSRLRNKRNEEHNKPFGSKDISLKSFNSNNKNNLEIDTFNKNTNKYNQSNINFNNHQDRRKNLGAENFPMDEYNNKKISPKANEKLSATLQIISKFNVKATSENSFKQPNLLGTITSAQIPRNSFNSTYSNLGKNTDTNSRQPMNSQLNNELIKNQRGNFASKSNMSNNQNFATEINISRSYLETQNQGFKTPFVGNQVFTSTDRIQGNNSNRNSSPQMQRMNPNSNPRFSSQIMSSKSLVSINSIINMSPNSNIGNTMNKPTSSSNINYNRNNINFIKPGTHPISVSSLRPIVSNISTNSHINNASIRPVITASNSFNKSSINSSVINITDSLNNLKKISMSGSDNSTKSIIGSTAPININKINTSIVTTSNNIVVASQNQRCNNSTVIRPSTISNITLNNPTINPLSSLRFSTPTSVTLVLVKPNISAKSAPATSSTNQNLGINVASQIVNMTVVRPIMSVNKIQVSTSANIVKSNLSAITNVSSGNFSSPNNNSASIIKSSNIRPIVSSLGTQKKNITSIIPPNNSLKVINKISGASSTVSIRAATSTSNNLSSNSKITSISGQEFTITKPIETNSKMGLICQESVSMISASLPSSENSVKNLTSRIAQSALLVSSNLQSQHSKDVPTQDDPKTENLIADNVKSITLEVNMKSSAINITQSSNNITPSIQRVTPSSRIVTSSVSSATTSVTIVSPTVRNVITPARNITPAIRNITQSVKSVTPTIRTVNPVVRRVTPNISNTTPLVRSVAPILRNVTPCLRSSTPTIRNIIPTSKNDTKTTVNITSSVGNDTQIAKNTTPSLIVSSVQSGNSSVSSVITLNSTSGSNKRKLDDISLDKVKTMSVEDTAEIFCESISSILEQIMDADKKMNCTLTENNKIMSMCKAAERNAISSIKRILGLRNTVKAREILQIMQPIDSSILKKLVESKDDVIIKKMKMAGFDVKKMTEIIGAIDNMKMLNASTPSYSSPSNTTLKKGLLQTPILPKQTPFLHKSNYEHTQGMKRPADSRSGGYSEPPKRAMYQQQRFHNPQGSRLNFPPNNRPRFGRYNGPRGHW